MTSRNLTEIFVIMRNNASKNRHFYSDDRAGGDAERLLNKRLRDVEEGMEMRDDCGSPPIWIDKLEEAEYTISKIKPKLDELGSLHARHLLRPAFDERDEEEHQIELLSQEISKLITSTHRHIQCIRSSLGVGSKTEQKLTSNVITYLLLALQEITFKFRNTQGSYLRQLNSREELSQKYFKIPHLFNDFENGTESNFSENFESLPKATSSSATGEYYEETDAQLDEHFQRPVSSRMTDRQLVLFEEENTKLAERREQEVSKIVKSIVDLNDIFKDLSHMVHEQGTILDRIDYNVEQTHVRVSEGLKQLQQAEIYQRRDRKMCCILVLAVVTLFMIILLIFTKL